MALKPTIFKFRIAVSDLDRDYYDTLNLTVAQHPSETTERMVARVLVYCFNARERLQFSRGLSEPDTPDVLCRALDGSLELWLDVGEPEPDRIRKAVNRAASVRVYAFNSKALEWWRQAGRALAQLDVEYYRFEWEQIKTLAAMVQRTSGMSVTISDGVALVATDASNCEVSCFRLTAPE